MACGSTELNQKIAVQIEEWRNRPLRGRHPYVFLDGIWLKRSWGGEVKNVSILVAKGVDPDGYREVLGVMEGAKEDKTSWVNFMRHLKEHFYRDVWTAVPTSKVREVAAMLKAIHAQEDRAAAQAKAVLVVTKLREMKLAGAADCVEESRGLPTKIVKPPTAAVISRNAAPSLPTKGSLASATAARVTMQYLETPMETPERLLITFRW